MLLKHVVSVGKKRMLKKSVKEGEKGVDKPYYLTKPFKKFNKATPTNFKDSMLTIYIMTT